MPLTPEAIGLPDTRTRSGSTTGMIHICEQGVVEFRGECYPYAVFC